MRRRGVWLPLLACGLLWAAFYEVGTLYGGWALGLGSTQEPSQAHFVFLSYFALFGVSSVVLLTVALMRGFPDSHRWTGWDERSFLLAAVCLGFLVPAVLHGLVLAGADITDDESVYRFSASLLLSGHLTAPSHPLKLFFDHAFIVNDGRMYGQYFLGWPALLSLGLAIGLPGFVNPVLSALTVPALYLLTREMTSRVWAQLATVLFLASPMLQLLAATELPYTSALAALTWAAYLAVRSGRRDASPGWSALLGVVFSTAFFIRPLAALGIGLPFLAIWVARRLTSGHRTASMVAFAVPTLVMAGLFLWTNAALTGSPWKPPYLAWVEYARANGFRFSGLDPQQARAASDLAFRGPALTLRSVSLGLIRLDPVLFGWPVSFLFVPLAWVARKSRVLWVSVGLFLLLHAPLRDAGIDTVGPVHYAELALPLLVLSAMGLRVLGVRIGREVPAARRLVLPLFSALVASAIVLDWPARLEAAWDVGILASVPREVMKARGIHDAVVFSTMPWVAPCNPAIPNPPRPFVRWWPVNKPGLDGDVIHANHLSTARDRELMAYFPGRSGWIARWRRDCTLGLVPLGAPAADSIPNGIMLTFRDHVALYDDADPTGRTDGGSSAK